MVISPNDFSLWARLTGNKYPSTPKERAQKGPEVQNFIQNLGKEGMLEGKDTEEPKKENNLGKNIAKGALIAGGIAALGAASRDKRVQDIAQRAASTTKTKIDDFLSNLGGPRVIDRDIVDASYDVTPDPVQQQSNVAPQLTGTSAAGRLTPLGDDQLRDRGRLLTFNRNISDIPPETINEVLTGARLDRELDEKVKTGKLTRGDERRFLKREFRKMDIPADPNTLNQRLDSFVEDSQQPFFGDPAFFMRDRSAPDGYVRKTPFEIKQFAKGVRGTVTDIGSAYNPRNIFTGEPVAVDRFTPAVEGKTFGTSGAVSKLEDIGDAKLRARRTYGPLIDATIQKNPGINVGSMGRSMLAKAEQDRDYDIAYMVARGQGKTDETATQIARQTAGFPTDSPVGKPTPYREFLGEQRTGSIRPESIDNLLNLVKTGPQINLPESVQEPGALVQLAAGSTPSNKVPTMGPTIGGSSLTDQHATEMAVDNALDNARANYERQVSTIVEAGKTKGGSISTAAKAEQFLQKMRPTVVKELDKAIQEDLTKTTGLNPEDASFAADRSLNPVSGFVERNPDQSIAKKDLREERIAKIGEFIKPASNTGLRGTTGRPGIGLYGTPTETRKFGSESQPFGKGSVGVTKVTMQEGEGVPGRPDLGGRTETVPNVFDAGKTDPKRRTPEGLIYTEEALRKPTDMGGRQGFSSQPPTANPGESVQVADELRKIQTDQNISPEKRKSKAKDFLKQKMSERGISAIGESEPLRKR